MKKIIPGTARALVATLLPFFLYAQDGAWSRKADFEGDGRSFAASFVISDKAYVGGGNKVV